MVTFRYGLFSHLWVDMMQRLGLDVTVIEGRWGDGAYEDKLAEVLKADTGKKIKAVCVVHNETTTGVTSDIGEVRCAVLHCAALCAALCAVLCCAALWAVLRCVRCGAVLCCAAIHGRGAM